MIKCTERSGVYQAVKRLLIFWQMSCGSGGVVPALSGDRHFDFIRRRRPVFYKHTRVGKGGKTFQMYKFRTMYQDRRIVLTPEQQVELQQEFKLENDPRVTRIGSKLRMSSLDELPQLLNILKGDMSFVGPRPIMEREFEFYTPAETAAFQSVKARSDRVLAGICPQRCNLSERGTSGHGDVLRKECLPLAGYPYPVQNRRRSAAEVRCKVRQ